MNRPRSGIVASGPMDERTPETASADDLDLIDERLTWTPRERLQYLLDMLAFEERAHAARRVERRS